MNCNHEKKTIKSRPKIGVINTYTDLKGKEVAVYGELEGQKEHSMECLDCGRTRPLSQREKDILRESEWYW